MTSLYNAMYTNDSRTDNGAMTHSTTNSKCLDFFTLAGSARGVDLVQEFKEAWNENPDVAIRTLLWSRDIRGGAGNRNVLRQLWPIALDNLANGVNTVKFNLSAIEMGRWDDVLSLVGTPHEAKAFVHIRNGLKNEDQLCAKWMPRKGPVAAKLRKYLGLSPKAYRKLLVGLSNTVETQMCAKQWDQINFEHVPSVASARYQKAFGRNAPDQYGEYLGKLESGEAKIHAGAIFPHNICQTVRTGNPSIADQQWKALPNYMEGSDDRVLPMIDVSGSMYQSIGGSTTAIHVAISLGLYISERSTSIFKDTFLTFSERPEMCKVTGTLRERCNQISKASWGYNTDLAKALGVILKQAMSNDVPEDQMPTKLIVLSDMEFDSCGHQNNLDLMKQMYQASGYTMPHIVFWNLTDDNKNNHPAKTNEEMVSTVSGFSPSILKSVLSGKVTTPYQTMLETVMTERYRWTQ